MRAKWPQKYPGKWAEKEKWGEFTRSSASNSLGLQHRGPTSRSSSRRLREAAGFPTLQDRRRGRWGKKERRFLRSARNRSVLFRFVLFCSVVFCFAPFGFVLFCSELERKQQKTKMFYSVLSKRKTAFCFVFSTTPETEDKNANKEKTKDLLCTHKR